jgi:hypothetical protein
MVLKYKEVDTEGFYILAIKYRNLRKVRRENHEKN